MHHSGAVLWLSPGFAPHFSQKKWDVSVCLFGTQTIVTALLPKFDYFNYSVLFILTENYRLSEETMNGQMQFSGMCYIPVTAHHAHDLFIDVLLVVFL